MKANNRITQTYITAHPEQAARSVERLPRAGAAALLEALPAATRTVLLFHMLGHEAGACLAVMDGAAAVAALQALDPTAAARIVKAAPALQRPFLEVLDERGRLRMRRLLSYRRETVGAMMESLTGVLPQEATVGEAVRRVQSHREDRGCEYFIIDSRHRLMGTVNAAELLKAPHGAPLSVLLRRPPPVLLTHMNGQAAAAHTGWLTQRRLPVVESDGTLVGILHYRTLAAPGGEQAFAPQAPAPGTVAGLAEVARLYWAALAHTLNTFAGRS